MYTRVFKPEEKYAWQAFNRKKHIWFFFFKIMNFGWNTR